MTTEKRIREITDAIMAREKRYLRPHTEWMHTLFKKAIFPVKDAPRQAVHVPTSASETFELMDQLKGMGVIPGKVSALDLGSGLGTFSISLSFWLKDNGFNDFHITGLEISPDIHKDAVHITDELGAKNVSFIEEDFTEMTEKELKQYNLIYTFKPFKEGYKEMMEPFLPRIAPGTLVITRGLGEVEALRKHPFRFLSYLLHEVHGKDFEAFIRTED